MLKIVENGAESGVESCSFVAKRTILMLNQRGIVKKSAALLAWSAFSMCLSAQVTLGPNVGTFGVLAGSAVTNTGNSVVNGNVGVYASTSITGFPPGLVSVPFALHSADGFAQAAQSDLTTAYTTAQGLTCPGVNNLSGTDLGGLTLAPGVYCFSTSAQLTGTLTLSGAGQYVFQIGSTLTTASGSAVVLINGALAGNVFWQVGTSATLGTTTAFVGNILAQSTITLNNGASLSGRALARIGAVNLNDNAISGAVTAGSPVLSNTTAPSSLSLVILALGCVWLYRWKFRVMRS